MRKFVNTGLAVFLAAVLAFLVWAGKTSARHVTSAFFVENISCASCVNNIARALQDEERIFSLSYEASQKLLLVRHAPEFPPEEIAVLVSGQGYPARVAPEETLAGLAEPIAPYVNTAGCIGCDPESECTASASSWQRLLARFFTKEQQSTQR